MEDWQQRVVSERDELAARLDRLSAFLEGDRAMAIESYPRVLLIRQRRVMSEYLSILDERIALFNGDKL